MTWNYRVVKRTVGDAAGYGIHEVYYSDDGSPEMCSEHPSLPYGETPDELAQDLLHFAQALEKPVLDYDSFGAK